jgi:hypothetical protein
MADEGRNIEKLFGRVDSLRTRSEAIGDGQAGDQGKSADEPLPQEAVVASQKSTVATEKDIGEGPESATGPVGLDVGTSHIVAAHNRLNHIHTVKQLNAFFTVPVSKFSSSILRQHGIMFFERNGLFYIVGIAADNFANMFNTSTSRPIQEGLLSPTEKEGLSVVQAVVSTLLKKPEKFGESICYAIPGAPLDGPGSDAVIYHERVINMFLSNLGYSPVSINEGMAVVLSELADDDYTGIGISMGGGMCNVCLSYMSFPVITFSLQTAGDYIDRMAGLAVGETATKVKGVKEAELDLTREPKGTIQTALHIYYDELIYRLISNLQRVLTATDKIPKIANPIPIVLSGGTAMPSGCQARFEKVIDKVGLPVDISEVRMAADPLNSTAKGALIMAMTEAG